jgi:hypothetical protein
MRTSWCSTSAGALACWAWDEIELATTIAGIQYTEIRVDPPAFRRTRGGSGRERRRRESPGP